MIIKLLPHQFAFMTHKAKFLWLCAGLGAGKSYTLAHYCIQRALTNPETMGLICAASYSQLNNSILKELFRQLDAFGLKYTYSSLAQIIHLHANGAQIKVFSLENYELIRGIEVGWIAIDEACLSREEAYNVVIGRLRCKFSKKLECRIVSTPRGYDFLYDRYVGEAWGPDHAVIHATAYDNPHLPEDYIAPLKRQYSPKMFRQEVLAEFVSNAEGNVYHAFDRQEHATKVDRLPGVIWAGVDFNVNPMTGILAQVRQGSIVVFDEIYIKNGNTFMLRDEILKRYPHETIKLVPDATGHARKTSSTKSDHEILREGGFRVLASRSNPAVEDRYNTVNGRLAEGRIQIDRDKCPMLIRDLERVTHEKNPDYLTHISDALGYLAWHTFPIKKARPPSRVVQL